MSLMLKALRRPSIALLWTGQVTSAVGDEIYRVALVWLAVGFVGADAGYIAAGEAGMVLLFSLMGGAWADRWNPLKTLLVVDISRAVIVSLPFFFASHLSMPLIWCMALSLSALSAFFEPALQSLLPRLAPEPELRQATNGLMATTFRLARVLGPGLVGLLSTAMSMVYFFLIDALSFALSTASIAQLAKNLPMEKDRVERAPLGILKSVAEAFRIARDSPTMTLIMASKCVCGGAWHLAYGLGLALLVRKLAPGDIQAFGLVVGAYGLGNVAAALVLGSLPRVRLVYLVYVGYVVLGSGFIFMSAAPSIRWLMGAASFAAIGGVLNDLPFIDLIQSRYSMEEIPKLFRLRTVLDTSSTLLVMLVAPQLFRVYSIEGVLAGCGWVTFSVGIVGLLSRPLHVHKRFQRT